MPICQLIVHSGHAVFPRSFLVSGGPKVTSFMVLWSTQKQEIHLFYRRLLCVSCKHDLHR